MLCESIYLRIPQQRIGFLKFLLEGYEGLAILSTMNSSEGLVRLLVPGSRLQELMRFLDMAAHEFSD